MSTDRRPFAGRTDATGFVIDPAFVDSQEVARRVADWWTAGATLCHLEQRIVLALPEPVSVRCDRAPGLPVLGGGGVIDVIEGGHTRTVRIEELRKVDLRSVLDISAFEVERLEPVPTATPRIVDPGPRIAVDPPPVRALAGVRRRSRAAQRQVERLQRETASAEPGLAARLLGRSSPERLLSRRNARYVDDLSRRFKARDWDAALSSAIGVDGLGGGGWAFRLPRRGRVTGPRSHAQTGATSHAFGESLHSRLRTMYLAAAEQLEQEGKHLLAAFVHVDLLNNPLAGIEIVERSGDFRKAAEMAEGLVQDPALSVRLWWRAGDRARAIAVASARGAFADAVGRLETIDPLGATELRRAWVAALRNAGDRPGAVAAAWPCPELRDEVMSDIGASIAGGDRASGTLLAYLLEHVSTDSARETARQLLRGEPVAARDAFLIEQSRRKARDPATERELATLALLAITTDPGTIPVGKAKEIRHKLAKRADPLVAADLPTVIASTRPPTAFPHFDLTDGGPVMVFDAVAVDGSTVVLAMGERGVRLVGRDGRTRASWDVPTYSVVIADHGARVLLLAPRGDRYLVHELDLPLGRPRLMPPLLDEPLSTYDGSRVIVVGRNGIEWLEEQAGRWVVVWRELTDGQQIHAVERAGTSMTALFRDRSDGLQAWQWELPALALRQRGPVDLPTLPLVRATGNLGTVQAGNGVVQLSWHSPYGHRITAHDLYPRGELTLHVTGDVFALDDAGPDNRRLSIRADLHDLAAVEADLPTGSVLILRSHGDLITFGHTAGRVVAVDLTRRASVCDIKLTM